MSRHDKLILMAFVLVTVLSVLLIQALPTNGQVVVFGKPFSNQAEVGRIVASSGGTILGSTGLSWAILARFENPGFQSILYLHGAFFVGDANFVLSCFGRGAPSQPFG